MLASEFEAGEAFGEGIGALTGSASLDPIESVLEERFCARLHAWDRHVAGCRQCLARGVELCDQGEEIRATVAAARWTPRPPEGPAGPELPSLPTFGPGLFRRAWIGWVALIAPLTG